MKKIWLIIIVLGSIIGTKTNTYSYVSKFLNIEENSIEMKLLKKSQSYSLKEGALAPNS